MLKKTLIFLVKMSGGWVRRSMNGYILVERNEVVLFNVHEQFVLSSPFPTTFLSLHLKVRGCVI